MNPLLEHETEPIYRLRVGLEQIVRDTETVGSDSGIPHVAKLANELLELCRPRAILAKPVPPRWRVGGRVTLNVYEVSSPSCAGSHRLPGRSPYLPVPLPPKRTRNAIVKALNLVEPFPPEAE